jgi:hypothetical protein
MINHSFGDIVEADVDYLWRGDRVVWRKGQQGRIVMVFLLTFKVIPAGKHRSIEVEKSHPHHLVRKAES